MPNKLYRKALAEWSSAWRLEKSTYGDIEQREEDELAFVSMGIPRGRIRNSQ